MGEGGGDAFFSLWLTVVGLLVVGWILWLVALIDVIRREFDDPSAKVVWVVVVAVVGPLGALVYWFMGMDQGRLPRARRPRQRVEEGDGPRA